MASRRRFAAARWRLLACAALGVLAGCEDNLPRATEIASMRVLGARLEVEGDESRTTPEPGERLHVTLPIVFPEIDYGDGADGGVPIDQSFDDMRSMFVGCTAPDRFTGGLPVCQEIIDAALSGADVSDALPMIEEERLTCSTLRSLLRGLPRLERDAVSIQCANDVPSAVLQVPDDFEADAMLMLGVVCERGDPYIEPLDPLLFGCEETEPDPKRPPIQIIRTQSILPVQQRDEGVNHNPSLEAFSVLRQNVEWVAPDPAELFEAQENCAEENPRELPSSEGDEESTLHWVVPGAHEIRLRYDAGAREEFDGEPENLEITVYTTAGEMERRFTLFRGSDPGDDGVLESVLEWEPPKPEPGEPVATGKLVRFFITLRDQRGGFATTERALCLE